MLLTGGSGGDAVFSPFFFFFCGYVVEIASLRSGCAVLEVRVCATNYPGFYFCLQLDWFPLFNTSNIFGFTSLEAVFIHDLMWAILALWLKLSHRSIMQAACYDLQLRFETVQSSGHAHNGNLWLAITASLLVCKSSSRCSINAKCNCTNLYLTTECVFMWDFFFFVEGHVGSGQKKVMRCISVPENDWIRELKPEPKVMWRCHAVLRPLLDYSKSYQHFDMIRI